jgi:hypothetical protein
MNAALSASAELALRKQVERAVRPVRASAQTKLRMRQELLAHLSDIYCQEAAQDAEIGAALAASFRRFGSPAELTVELDRSVGMSERWAWRSQEYEMRLDRFFSKGEQDTWFRYVARSVAAMAAFSTLLVAAMPAFSIATGGSVDPTTYILLAKMLPLMIVGECTALIATQAIDRLTARQRGLRRWLALVGQVLAWSAFLLLCTTLFWWSVVHRPLTAGEFARTAISILATVFGLLIVVAFGCDYARRRKEMFDAWRLLELD